MSPDLIEFFASTLEVRGLSPHGLVVAQLLDETFGLEQFRRRHISGEVRWDHPTLIEVIYRGALASYGPDRLTQLVVRCHDACVRLEVGPCGQKTIRLSFSARRRVADVMAGHPQIEAAIDRVRRFTVYGKVD
jgi:hypothetical protein